MDESDKHGKKQLGKSVLSNWTGQMVQIVSGFIIPRLIDSRIGQEGLGVWDFAWSTVAYFALVQMGITTSINRYVAFHRAKGDIAGINRVTSSSAMVMRVMASVSFLAAIIVAIFLPQLFAKRLGTYLVEAQWLVFLLGTGIAVQISSAVFASVLTGHHRWDIHNGIQAATNVLTLLGMAGALLAGWGLIGLAAVHLGCETVGRLARVVAAHKVSPGLKVSLSNFDKKTAREMMGFGGKQFLTTMSQMILNSGISLLIVGKLGPAALALYARPGALMRNMGTFVNKYAMVFSPTVSSMQADGRQDEIVSLALKASRYGLFLSLPFFLFLLAFGGEVLNVWMGAKYEDSVLIRLLVWASFFNVAYLPLFKCLVGLNLHARLGWVYVCGTVIGLTATYVALNYFHASLAGVAVLVAILATCTNGVYLPMYAMKQMRIPFRQFWNEMWREPLLCAAIYAPCFFLFKYLTDGKAAHTLIFGGLLSFLVLVPIYWKAVLPPRAKKRLLGKVMPSWQRA